MAGIFASSDDVSIMVTASVLIQLNGGHFVIFVLSGNGKGKLKAPDVGVITTAGDASAFKAGVTAHSGN